MITLQMTKNDYFDAEEDCYVMTIGASVNCLQTDVVINDEGVTWECYLYSVEFLPSTGRGVKDKYIVKYKCYGI